MHQKYIVDIWEYISWSRYRGRVFTKLYDASKQTDIKFSFYYIAETDIMRQDMESHNKTTHQYPYTVLFRGSYDKIQKIRLFARCITAVATTNADLIILRGYHFPEYWLQMAVLKWRGKKVAVFFDATAKDNPQTAIKTFLKRLFLFFCDGALCYGTLSANYAGSLGVSPSRIWLRCQAPALADDYTPEQALRSRLAVVRNREAPQFLFVGRLAAEKGIDIVMSAFARIVQRYPMAVLKLVGSGPEEASIEAMVRGMGLASSVQFTGNKFDDDLWTEYLQADYLILPSKRELWGLVANEALSYGCPIIVSDCCGCVPELVHDGVTGFAFHNGDATDLADKMERSISQFSDVPTTAQCCIACAMEYLPERAASQIYQASHDLLNGTHIHTVGMKQVVSV